MTNYVKTTNFAAKDALLTGNPAKVAKGTEINTEFDNIATAIATKYDSTTQLIITFQLTSLGSASPTISVNSPATTGWSCTRTTTGTYAIAHNIGSTNYTVGLQYKDSTDAVFVLNNTQKTSNLITIRAYKFSAGAFALNDPDTHINVQIMFPV